MCIPASALFNLQKPRQFPSGIARSVSIAFLRKAHAFGADAGKK
jgi:hypothetical protein